VNLSPSKKFGARTVTRCPQALARRRWDRVVSVIVLLAAASAPARIHAQISLNPQFVRSLDENGLTFRETALQNYSPAQITANPHMNYELAVRSRKVPLEIRYAIRRYDESPKVATAKPELVARAIFQAVMLNIAQDGGRETGVLDSTEFDAKDVQHDFNAEWGATALVIPKSEFARGFDRCMIVYVYRKRGGAFTFYLFNNQGAVAAMKEVEAVFTILRFR
jgi:hypothetical protein